MADLSGRLLRMPVFIVPSIFRDIALSAQIAAILFALQFSLNILMEWRKQKTRRWNDLRVGWAMFLLLAAVHLIFFTIADFYTQTPSERAFWIRPGYISLQVGLLVLTLAVNRVLPYRAFHVFSALCVGTVIVSIVLPLDLLRILAFVVIAPIVVLELLLLTYFTVRTVKGRMRMAVGAFFFAFMVMFVGYAFMSDAAVATFSVISYTIGAVVLAAGCIVMGVALPNITDFDEFNWWRAVMELYILTRDGIGLMSVDFSEVRSSTLDTESLLASSGIAGIREVLKRIMQTEEDVQVVDHGTLKMLFAYSEHVVGVLVVKKPLETLVRKLASFVDRFEVLFAGVLEDFDGNIEVFVPAQRLALTEFTIETPTRTVGSS